VGRRHRIVICGSKPWLAYSCGVCGRVSSPAQIFEHPAYLGGVIVMALLAALMIFLPLTSAGRSERTGAAHGDDVVKRVRGTTQGHEGARRNLLIPRVNFVCFSWFC